MIVIIPTFVKNNIYINIYIYILILMNILVTLVGDLFHYGHINILLKAKKYGTVIVGLMTDNGIKIIKKKKI